MPKLMITFVSAAASQRPLTIGSAGQNENGAANNSVLETETLIEIIIPETEVVQEDLLDGNPQETQLLPTFQETQLIRHEPSYPKALDVTDWPAEIHVGSEESQLRPPPEVQFSGGPPHVEENGNADAPSAAQSSQPSKEATPDQPAMQTEPIAEKHNHHPIILPTDPQRKGLPSEQAYAETSCIRAAAIEALASLADPGSKVNALPESMAAVSKAPSEPLGVLPLRSLTEGLPDDQWKLTTSLENVMAHDEGIAVLQMKAEAGEEGRPEHQEKTPDLFDLEAVQFTAAAATQGTLLLSLKLRL